MQLINPSMAIEKRSVNDFRFEDQKLRYIWFEDFQYSWNTDPVDVLVPLKLDKTGTATVSFVEEVFRSCLKIEVSSGNELLIYPHIIKNIENFTGKIYLEVCEKRADATCGELNFGFIRTGNTVLNDARMVVWNTVDVDDLGILIYNGKTDFDNTHPLDANFHVFRIDYEYALGVPVNAKGFLDGVPVVEVANPDNYNHSFYPLLHWKYSLNDSIHYVDYIKVWSDY